MSPTLSLSRVASNLPFTYTGADFYALCSDAMLKAITRKASAIDAKIAAMNSSLSTSPTKIRNQFQKETPRQKITTAYFFDHYATSEDIAVLVTEEDFLAAHRELIPSVSAKELEHYSRVRKLFEGEEEKKKKDVPIRPAPVANHVSGPNGSETGNANGSASARRNKGKGKAIDMDGDWGGDAREIVDQGFEKGQLEDDEDLY